MFGFLKDTLKKTIENFSKKVDEETKNIEPTEEQKEELIKEIKKEQEEKGFFQKLKDTFTKEETKELAQEAKQILAEEKKVKETEKEVQKEEKQIEKEEEELLEEVADLKEKKAEEKEIFQQKKEEIQNIEEKIEEGEKELEELEKKEEEVREKEQELTEKEEALQEEKKGFFAKLKEKIFKKEEETLEKEEGKKQELFETTDKELEEFQEAFKETEKEVVEEETEEIIPIITEEAGETKVELKEKHIEKKRKVLEKKEEKGERKKTKAVEEAKKEEIKVEGEEKGFFAALKETIFKTSLSEEKFEELFWDIEVVLLENNVAVEVIDLIKTNLKKELVEKKILRGQIDTLIIHTLKKAIEETFHVEQLDLLSKVKEKTPFVLVFVGVNGSGKTTTIAKIAYLLQQHSKSCVIAAGDTFRAAAIQQLEEHAKKLKVKLIKHDYGADPAAVGFDAIMYAKAHNIDCVLIDTAGRLHSNVNLMDEMKKIMRVTKPDLKLFIGEAITGNDCVEQARRFHDSVGIDGIILAKADVDEKGGAALSVSYVTKKPILYFGTGQRYQDLEPFDKNKVMERLGLK